MRIDSIDKKECTGCMACMSSCPKKAIVLAENDWFSYPEIVLSECINCGKCGEVCPTQNEELKVHTKKIYAAKNKDEEIHLSSQSGGVFYELAKQAICHEGKVFGAAFADDWSVKHICVDSMENICFLQGSKYVQSDTKEIFEKVSETLKSGCEVVFSGTPCQCAALLGYLGNHPENLLLVDLICHGVPSPKLWRDFLDYCKKKFRGEIENAQFRVQDGTRRGHVECVTVGGKKHFSVTYGQLFYSHAFFRENCFRCSYKSFERVGDVTIGDWVGGMQRDPDFWDPKGVSLVLVNTKRGQEKWDRISDCFVKKELTEESAKQPPLCGKQVSAEYKEAILKLYHSRGFKAVARKYGHESFWLRVKRRLKKMF